MKKIILSLSIAAGLFAFDKVLPQNETLNILKSTPIYNQLAPLLKNKKVSAKATEKEGFYIIEINTPRGKGLVYVTKDKKYTIIGQVIDNKTKKPLIPNFPKNVEVIKKGVMFTFGKGNKDIYLVTDPECPFCRMMEKQKKELLEKNYRVHVILMPLPFHKDAKAMSYYILAGKTDAERAKRLKEVLSGSNAWKNYHPTKEEIAKYNKELAQAKAAANELGARGTPSVYDKNFNPIPWPSLGAKK
ncbi:thioredoxin fold domain-containing protein [Caminibacter sp.]